MSDKIEQFWRDATADDVARVMSGEVIEARFRRNEADCWVASGVDGCSLNLAGWYKDAWLDHEYDAWVQCQVYDPPEWFVNKPDPGEGYRLLEKFPVEDKLATDEQWSNFCGKWMHQSSGRHVDPRIDKLQVDKVWYRRRIANNPEIPDSSNSSETPHGSRSRDIIPSDWRLLGKDEDRLASDLYWSQGCNEWLLIGDDRVEYANDKTGKWHAIRRMEDFVLVEGFMYTLPSGKVIRITAKGFEVV